jgi:hypothetical protein
VLGLLYDGDKLKKTRTIGGGDGVHGRILSDHGGNTIGELRCMMDVTKKLIVEEGKMSGITLVTLQNNVKDALVGDATHSKVDQKRAVNPYESRYDNAWMEKIIEVKAFTWVKCITAMVAHVMAETERVTKGTKYEDEWYFYHDALSQMMRHETK